MITEKQAEKLMKETNVSIEKSFEDWRQIGECLSHYKKLLGAIHRSKAENLWESDEGSKAADAKKAIAEQIITAMHQEDALRRELTKHAVEKLHPVFEELNREHKKTK